MNDEKNRKKESICILTNVISYVKLVLTKDITKVTMHISGMRSLAVSSNGMIKICNNNVTSNLNRKAKSKLKPDNLTN